MIELHQDRLVFSFPEVHPQARLTIEFQRTLRIPDDGRTYPLPPGLGRFPLRHVDDHAAKVPPGWLEHGGVLLPMYQAEALWIRFESEYIADRQAAYPFAIKVATGKVCAVTGKSWADGLRSNPQDYMVAPNQPWLDGYCVVKGSIRQFVAMPLGAGYTAEEQVTGKAEHGGLQIVVYPMKSEVFEKRFAKRTPTLFERIFGMRTRLSKFKKGCLGLEEDFEMGLAPGGLMRQEIYEDPFGISDWDQQHRGRCFVHIANSLTWRDITSQKPPTAPPTSKQYSQAGLPWFDYYGENAALPGSPVLQSMQSVAALGKQTGDVPLPENDPAYPEIVVGLRSGLSRNQVREGTL